MVTKLPQAPVPGRGTDDGLSVPPALRHDLHTIERLYRIGTLLAGFESVEETLPQVLGVLAGDISLNSVVLVLRTKDGRRTFAWKGPRVCPRRLVEAEQRAWEAYAYLVPNGQEDGEGDVSVTTGPLPGAVACPIQAPRPFLALPLTVGVMSTFGVLQLELPEPLGPSQLMFLNVVVNQLALALDRERSRRAERTARREAEYAAHRLNELQAIAELLLQSETLGSVLPEVMRRVASLFHTGIGLLLLADPSEQTLQLRAVVGLREAGAMRMRFGEGVAGQIALYGPMSFEDVTTSEGASRILISNGVRSLVGAPLRARGRVTGVLEVASLQRRRFTAEDLRLVTFIAARLGVAIEHARMLEQEQRFRHSLEDISAAAVRISNALVDASEEPEPTWRSYQAAVDAAREVTHAEHAALCGYDGHGHPLQPVLSGVPDERRREPRCLEQAASLLARVGRSTVPLRESYLHRVAELESAELCPAIGPFLGMNARSRGQLVGTIYVARAPGEPLFTADDQRVLELLTAHAGVALETARLTTDLTRDRARLAEAVRAQELMTAVVSHDLKNPLSTIRTSCDIMLRDADHALIGPRARPHVERVRRSVERMWRLIQDLLDVSQIEAGQLKVNPEPLRAAGIVDEVVDQLAPLASQKGLELRKEVADHHAIIGADRERLIQALSNLVGNAIKFTTRGAITVGLTNHADEVWFRVTDSGPGIAAEHLPHVFDRYWQARSTAHLGSGLGLSIAKGVVDGHHGRIWVESRLGEGATFFIALPKLHRAAALQAEQATPP